MALTRYEKFHNVNWDFDEGNISGSIWDERTEEPKAGQRVDLVRASIRDGFKDTQILASEWTNQNGYFEFYSEYDITYRGMELAYRKMGSSCEIRFYLESGGMTSTEIELELMLANAGIVEIPTESSQSPEAVEVKDTGAEDIMGQENSYGGQCPSGFVWDPVFRECVKVKLPVPPDPNPIGPNPGYNTHTDRDVATISNLPLIIIAGLLLSIAMFMRR